MFDQTLFFMAVNDMQILLKIPMHYQAKDGESKRVYQPSIVILIKNQILQTGV